MSKSHGQAGPLFKSFVVVIVLVSIVLAIRLAVKAPNFWVPH